MSTGLSMDDFRVRFEEEPGYLDFARMAPVGATPRAEEQALMSMLARSRFGSLLILEEQDLRVRDAVSVLTGFNADQIVFQPNTSQGLMHVMAGLTGRVAVSRSDFPSSPFAITRADAPLGVAPSLWLETDHGRVTPGNLRDQLTDDTVAVATEVAIAAATTAAVGMLHAPLVVVFTKSGFSARIVAAHRPGVSILVLTDQPRTFRQLALVWGVIPELVPHCDTYEEMMALAKDVVVRRELAAKGDRVVVTAGVPFDVPGTTNLLKVEIV